MEPTMEYPCYSSVMCKMGEMIVCFSKANEIMFWDAETAVLISSLSIEKKIGEICFMESVDQDYLLLSNSKQQLVVLQISWTKRSEGFSPSILLKSSLILDLHRPHEVLCSIKKTNVPGTIWLSFDSGFILVLFISNEKVCLSSSFPLSFIPFPSFPFLHSLLVADRRQKTVKKKGEIQAAVRQVTSMIEHEGKICSGHFDGTMMVWNKRVRLLLFFSSSLLLFFSSSLLLFFSSSLPLFVCLLPSKTDQGRKRSADECPDPRDNRSSSQHNRFDDFHRWESLGRFKGRSPHHRLALISLPSLFSLLHSVCL